MNKEKIEKYKGWDTKQMSQTMSRIAIQYALQQAKNDLFEVWDENQRLQMRLAQAEALNKTLLEDSGFMEK